jgi:hypothetical protein
LSEERRPEREGEEATVAAEESVIKRRPKRVMALGARERGRR